jgi:undecaprenyl diphosphate synthase
VRKTITAAAKQGIKAITLFAFSSENWRRPEEEVSFLMDLFATTLSKEAKKLHKNNLQLRIIGDISKFPANLQEKICQAQLLTENNSGMVINVAANYGGKWDITQAAKAVAAKVNAGLLTLDEITESTFSTELTMADLPEVDLFIRTSGECRISNFMLWQMAYAEIYFTDVYWPEFDEKQLEKAITWFASRERRFGSTSEQIKILKND